MIFIGIDPGRYGAVSVLTETGELEAVIDLPIRPGTPEPLGDELAAFLLGAGRAEDLFVTLEEPFAMAARVSLLKQGVGYGVLLGVVQALEIQHVRIIPKQWKKRLGLPMGSSLSNSERKQNSLDHATMLWPDMAKANWPLKKHDGRAEACLIGEAGRQQYLESLA